MERPLRKLAFSPGILALAATLGLVASVTACEWAALPTHTDGWVRVIAGIGYVVAMSAAAHRAGMRDHRREAKKDQARRGQDTHTGPHQATSVGQPTAA